MPSGMFPTTAMVCFSVGSNTACLCTVIRFDLKKIFFLNFWDRVSLCCPGWSQLLVSSSPPSSASQSAKITGVSHHTRSNVYFVWNYLPRIFTGSTRLDGNAIGMYLTYLWKLQKPHAVTVLTVPNEALRVLLGLACSWLCPLAVCCVHGWTGFPPPSSHVQLAEDCGDIILQHESDPTTVVSNMACDWRSLQ